SIIRRERRLSLAGMALCLALAAPAPAFAAGSDTVRSLYDTLLATMRNGPALGARGRYAQIEPVIRRVFDIPFMTRLAVGPEWADRKSTRLNSSHVSISYAVFCLKKKISHESYITYLNYY